MVRAVACKAIGPGFDPSTLSTLPVLSTGIRRYDMKGSRQRKLSDFGVALSRKGQHSVSVRYGSKKLRVSLKLHISAGLRLKWINQANPLNY